MKVAINGFGRIGRLVFRSLIKRNDVEVVGINDLTDVETLAHLLKYDSVHGRFEAEIGFEGDQLIVDGERVRVYASAKPELLPWKDLGVDVVVEATGRFTTLEEGNLHIQAGARKVVITAPASGGVPTIVLGVNDDTLTGNETVVSNASCTTNCLAPMAKVLHEKFGIEKGYMTTIHAYTADQRLQDAPHKDLRRARAAALSMIPTTTGAAKAVGLVLPELKGKLDGYAMRVPVPDGSITDLTVILNREVTAAEVNAAIKEAAASSMKGIIEYTEDPIVSIDIVGNTHSCIFDSQLTSASGKLVKVCGWYDNERGYSERVAELVMKIG
jgi:glyceraldehyde 3-phosphate dehydrogenase